MDPIKMHPVISTNVKAAGYDEKTQTLRLQFSNGQTYQYENVPKWAYQGIFTAESAGKFVRENIIKSKRFKTSKVSTK